MAGKTTINQEGSTTSSNVQTQSINKEKGNFLTKRFRAFQEGKLKEKYARTFWALIMLKYFFVLVGGIVIGFILSDKGLYFEHTGFKGFSTFMYPDFDLISHSYPINRTLDDQRLIVKNKWNDEVWTQTTIEFEKEPNGLDIECYVDKTNESCLSYRISAKDSAILKLIIRTGTGRKERYPAVCFKTFERGNKRNDYVKCLEININRYR